jgi:hypothetical protein
LTIIPSRHRQLADENVRHRISSSPVAIRRDAHPVPDLLGHGRCEFGGLDESASIIGLTPFGDDMEHTRGALTDLEHDAEHEAQAVR